MAFKVSLVGQAAQQYRISVGDGKPINTKDLDGVILALRHYYGVPSHAPAKQEDCPFCQVAY